MSIIQRRTAKALELESEFGEILSIPTSSWGTPDVRFNGERIPCARLWKIIADNLAEGRNPSAGELLNEARRADIYRVLDGRMLVWTNFPRTDIDTQFEGRVYARREKFRMRPLMPRFRVVMAKLEEVAPYSVREMIRACEKMGLYPFAAGEDKMFFSRQAEEIFRLFGTKDWVRLYVYFKRPGTSPTQLDFTPYI